MYSFGFYSNKKETSTVFKFAILRRIILPLILIENIWLTYFLFRKFCHQHLSFLSGNCLWIISKKKMPWTIFHNYKNLTSQKYFSTSLFAYERLLNSWECLNLSDWYTVDSSVERRMGHTFRWIHAWKRISPMSSFRMFNDWYWFQIVYRDTMNTLYLF